jgi:hypothetical protein
MDSDTCSEILARFPGPVTLYPSRRKWLLLMAGCLLFAVGGIGEAHNGNAMDWLGVAFFGLGAIVPGLMLLHGAASIRLDSDGFEMTNLFRHARLARRLRLRGTIPARSSRLCDTASFLEQVRSLRQRQSAKLDLDARHRAAHETQCAVGRHLWLQRR